MEIQKQQTVTVALPVHNEAENIAALLDALSSQKFTNIALARIIIYADGSTDNTVKIVKDKMRTNSCIELIEDEVQRGKFYRLNQIYKANGSDALIILDADIGIIGDDFIENFAMEIISDDEAMLVSAHELPIKPKDFTGRIIAATYTMWDHVRWSVPDCDHVQNLYNRATAYRGSFAKELWIPDEATEERLYLYLMAKKTNGFRYSRKVRIFYLPVGTVHDYLKLSERAFGRPQPAVNKAVGYDATYHYNIPRRYKLWGIIKSFTNDPFYTAIAFFMGIWLSRTVLKRETEDSPMWERSASSKKKIVINSLSEKSGVSVIYGKDN